MGKILEIKSINEEKTNVKLELTQKELIWLKGNLEKMHIFSENNLEFITRLVKRGKRESTKYFLMPKEFRKGVMPSDSVKCNLIETRTKYMFLFAVNKI